MRGLKEKAKKQELYLTNRAPAHLVPLVPSMFPGAFFLFVPPSLSSQYCHPVYLSERRYIYNLLEMVVLLLFPGRGVGGPDYAWFLKVGWGKRCDHSATGTRR